MKKILFYVKYAEMEFLMYSPPRPPPYVILESFGEIPSLFRDNVIYARLLTGIAQDYDCLLNSKMWYGGSVLTAYICFGH